ncbi:hypothetical protein EVAR_59535_1 [Eumeta japonica]|uniref:Uncharacterized protein n=1 Tax=Eumeta variegata TaxID=151549 RepID=A0A4C1XTK3_EUMVA|nr:hypothetical protein EVAR_59535_1 [Eumeta japonica]
MDGPPFHSPVAGSQTSISPYLDLPAFKSQDIKSIGIPGYFGRHFDSAAAVLSRTSFRCEASVVVKTTTIILTAPTPPISAAMDEDGENVKEKNWRVGCKSRRAPRFNRNQIEISPGTRQELKS